MSREEKSMDQEREIGNFDKLAARTKVHLLSGAGKSLETLQEVMDAAAGQLEKAGEFSREEGERARQYLKRDLAATRVDFDRAAKAIDQALNSSRVRGGFYDLTSHLFGSLSDVFRAWAGKSEDALAYRAGEISGPGTLTCTNCGAAWSLDRPSYIPPCQSCNQTEYRKSY
jgi:hypothetical protein